MLKRIVQKNCNSILKRALLFFFCFLHFCINGQTKISPLEAIKNTRDVKKQLLILEKALLDNQLSNPKVMFGYANAYDSISKIVNSEQTKINALNFNGNANYANENYAKAIDYYIKAVKVLETKKPSKRLSQIYNNLAGCYRASNDFNNIEKYFNKALKIGLDINDKPWVANISNNLAVVYMDKKMFNKADEMYKNALDIYKETNNTLMMGITYMNEGNSRISSKKYAEAITKYSKAIKLVPIKTVPLLHAVSQTGIGISLTQQKKYTKALKYLLKGKEIAESISHFEQLMESNTALSDYYSKTNNYKKAFDLYIETQQQKDSIKTIREKEILVKTLAKFEVEKKDAELKVLKLETEKLDQERYTSIIIAIAALFLALIIFFVLRKRIKYQKTITQQQKELHTQKVTELNQKNKLVAMNSMIEGQEAERLRIAKDLHDSLGGLLSTIKSHFVSIFKEDSNNLKIQKKTNMLIDEAVVEVRNISHNMMPHALSISGLESAVQDIVESLERQGYKVTFEAKNIPELKETQQIMIYRLIQEIIYNINKHAEASEILIQLLGHNNQLNIIIEDNGKGFYYDKAILQKGMGLKNINSRVLFLDASINWDSQLKEGTTITIVVPLN